LTDYSFGMHRSNRAGGADQGPPMAVTGNDLLDMAYGYGAARGGASALAGPARPAGARLLQAVRGAATPRTIGGVGTILALLSAASELNDPAESMGRNLAQATGSAGGTLAGGAGGALVGQALIPIPGVGALVGAALGGALGGASGRGLATLAADLVEGSPSDQALREARKLGQTQLELEADRLRTLMPLQDAAAQLAIANEVKRAEALSGVMNEQRLRDTMAAALLQQSQAAGAQQLATTQAVLGGLV
jgi:hypothetical protein